MKIDLHVHIRRTSRCARQQPEDAAKTALQHGIEGIVILDHHYYPTLEECLLTEVNTGIKIFKGNEINIKMNGGLQDIILVSPMKPPFDTGEYHKRSLGEDGLCQIINFCKQSNSFWFIAHPFRKGHPLFIDVEKYRPDGIEIASRNTRIENREKIKTIATKYDIPCLSTSDAHKTRQLGGWCIDTDDSIQDEIELGRAIKSKRFNLLVNRLAPLEIMPRNF